MNAKHKIRPGSKRKTAAGKARSKQADDAGHNSSQERLTALIAEAIMAIRGFMAANRPTKEAADRFNAAMEKVFGYHPDGNSAAEDAFLCAVGEFEDVVVDLALWFEWLLDALDAPPSGQRKPMGCAVIVELEPFPGNSNPGLAPLLHREQFEQQMNSALVQIEQGGFWNNAPIKPMFGAGCVALLVNDDEPVLSQLLSIIRADTIIGRGSISGHQPEPSKHEHFRCQHQRGNRYFTIGWLESSALDLASMVGTMPNFDHDPILENVVVDLRFGELEVSTRVSGIRPAGELMTLFYGEQIGRVERFLEVSDELPSGAVLIAKPAATGSGVEFAVDIEFHFADDANECLVMPLGFVRATPYLLMALQQHFLGRFQIEYAYAEADVPVATKES